MDPTKQTVSNSSGWDPASAQSVPRLGRLILVFGKGGVGKSTVATALARRFASRGRSCTLVAFGDAEVTREGGVERITLDADSALARAAVPLFRSKLVSRLVLANFAIQRLARAAPLLREVALLECVRQIAQASPKGVLVVDMPATGHGVAWLRAPRQMLTLLPPGPARRFVEAIDAEVNGPHASNVVVTLPETLPLRESLELCHALRETAGRPAAWVVVNRVPQPLAHGAVDDARALSVRAEPDAQSAASALLGAIEARVDAAARARHEIARVIGGESLAWSTLPEISGSEIVARIAADLGTENAA